MHTNHYIAGFSQYVQAASNTYTAEKTKCRAAQRCFRDVKIAGYAQHFLKTKTSSDVKYSIVVV